MFFGDGDARFYVAVGLRPSTRWVLPWVECGTVLCVSLVDPLTSGCDVCPRYRFRLIASDALTGPGEPGEPVTTVTTAIPTNSWSRPLGRAVGEGRAGSGRRAIDAPTAEVSMLPRCALVYASHR